MENILIENGILKECLDKTILTLNVPATVTKIGKDAFKDCVNLTNIVLPETVTEIESSAFEGCISLEYLEIPKGVKTIKSGTFYGCKNLKCVEIPEGVTSIKEKAFYKCKKLKSVTIPNSTCTICANTFIKCNKKLQIHIRKKLLKNDNEKPAPLNTKEALSLEMEKDSVIKFIKENGYITKDDIHTIIYNSPAIKIIEYCREQPRSRADIQSHLGIKLTSRGFFSKYINPLINNGFIKMTIPNKPKSKYQKYMACK